MTRVKPARGMRSSTARTAACLICAGSNIMADRGVLRIWHVARGVKYESRLCVEPKGRGEAPEAQCITRYHQANHSAARQRKRERYRKPVVQLSREGILACPFCLRVL